MSKQLTPEVIARWRTALSITPRAVLGDVGDLITYMLHLHDERQRLRNLQPEDVTEEQRTEWLNVPWMLRFRAEMHCNMIAAAVRVMVRDDTLGFERLEK